MAYPTDHLPIAVKMGCIHAVQAAIQKKESVAEWQIHKAFNAATKKGDIDILNMLNNAWPLQLDKTICSSLTLMHHAAMCGHANVIEWLVKHGSTSLDVKDKYGMTPMHYAIENGHLVAVTTLIKLGSQSIHFQDSNGKYPIHFAVKSRNIEMVKFIYEQDPDKINATEERGSTPLHIAVRFRNPTIATILIEYSAALDVLDDDGCSPLYLAIDYGGYECVEVLLYAGGEATTIQGPFRSTPLHFASLRLFPEYVELLARFDSRPLYMKNHNNQTPLSRVSEISPYGKVMSILLALTGENNENTSLDEDQRLEIRYRVHFSMSLVHILLCMPIKK
jgi:ankyrin repeat protein